MVYRVAPVEREAVLAQLDRREKGGFERREVSVHVGADGALAALVYVADPSNPNYLGPAPLDAIAEQALMRPLLNQLPLVEDEDAVSMFNGAKAMSDDKYGASLGELLHRSLDLMFTF